MLLSCMTLESTFHLPMKAFHQPICTWVVCHGVDMCGAKESGECLPQTRCKLAASVSHDRRESTEANHPSVVCEDSCPTNCSGEVKQVWDWVPVEYSDLVELSEVSTRAPVSRCMLAQHMELG